jgi:putative copper resistance protein D
MVTTLIITRALHIGASILITGIFTFDLVMFGLTDTSESNDLHEIERRLFRLAFWSLIAALFSALLWFWLEVASMSELSLKSALSTTAWEVVLFETQFGRVWQLRLALITIAFVLVGSALAQLKVRRAMLVVLGMVSVVLLISLGWISHAAAAGTVLPLGLLGDMLHLCAAGLWVGGLLPLTVFLARIRASFGETAVRVVRRFSTLSLCCVGVLVVSGISNSWLLVGSIHALFTTLYGRLLLFKLILFAILIAIGARNRLLAKAKPLKASAGRKMLSQLRRNVICEACLGAAVVAIVACLGVTPPARNP